MTDPGGPACFPLACGALGDYEHSRVADIAQALGPGLAPVHRDAKSVLLLDRPPLLWSAGGTRAFGWSEGAPGPGRVLSWHEAACRWAACGLVIEGHRRYLHTSVAGVAPLYYLQVGRATYFASRLHALVQASAPSLSVDWDAWAAIFFLRHALGARTPFLEARRLEPFSVLDTTGDAGARVRPGRWPWAEIEPELTVAEGAGRIAESARFAVRRLRGERVLCPLSGGRDSRLLLCLLQEERPSRVIGAFTGRLMSAHDERLAAAVASALDVPHSVVDAAEDRFASDFAESCKRMDYQWVSRGAFLPLATRLQSETTLLERAHWLAGVDPVEVGVTDGLGLGVLLGQLPVTTDKAVLRPGADVVGGLWKTMSQPNQEAVISPPLITALAASARRQLQAATDRWRGHPAQALLTIYFNRTVRGVSLGPTAELGRDLAVGMPFTDHELASAALSVRPVEKHGGRLYDALFSLVNPKVGALPSTHDDGLPRSPLRSTRLDSRQARHLYARAARRGPLSDYLTPETKQRLVGEKKVGSGNHFVRALTLFTLWHECYRDRLGEVDPREALG